MSIERLEELRSWQEARKLVRLIYSLSDNPLFKKDFELRHQARAAAVSSMENIAEAHGRFTFEDEGSIDDLTRQIGPRRRDAGKGR